MQSQQRRRVALVTGASSGIGEATVRALAHAGLDTVAAARRMDRCQAVAREVGGGALELDVTNSSSVAALAVKAGPVDVVVLGVLRVTQALLPSLRAGGDGHVVVIGSIAGREVYPGGGGAAKHAVRAVTQTLRLEPLGEPVRVTEIAPAWSTPSSRLCGSAGTPTEQQASTEG